MRSPCGVAANCCFLFYFVILFWFQLCLYVIAIWVAALTRFSFVFASLSCTERGLFPCCPLSCRSNDGQISVFDSTYLLDLDLWSHFTCWSQPLRIDCRDSARSLYSSMHFKVCSECLLHAMPHMARNPTTFPMCEGKDCCWPRCSSIVAIPPSLCFMSMTFVFMLGSLALLHLLQFIVAFPKETFRLCASGSSGSVNGILLSSMPP